VSAPSLAEAVRMGAEVFQTLKKQLKDAGHNTNVGDEGGFAPNLASADAALGFVTKAIEAAGYVPGEDIGLALDPASTEFFEKGKYVLKGEGKTLDAGGMVKVYEDLCKRYPILSIEDGMAEDDFEGLGHITKTLAPRCSSSATISSSPTRSALSRGIAEGLGNAILVKVNQIGTLSRRWRPWRWPSTRAFGV